MQKERSFWSDWAHFLHQFGLADFVATLLEAAGPLNIFLAQVMYAGRPLLSGVVREERLLALAGLFENQEEVRCFAEYLREESSG